MNRTEQVSTGLRFLPHDDDGVPRPTAAQQRILLEVARNAILAGLQHGRMGSPPAGEMETGPLFVTLWTRGGQLRGCVGHVEARCATLEQEVAECAVGAAFGDPRFPPLDAEELSGMGLDVTLLGRMDRVDGEAQLDPARWGVLVRGTQGRRGVLLPAIDGVDTAHEQVSIARRKAGLGPRDDVELYRYAVNKFGTEPGAA